MFQIPYNFDVNGAGCKENWVPEPEQMIFDMRTEETTRVVHTNMESNNFKAEFDVWQERPQIIKSELGEQPKRGWSPSIVQLQQFK